MHSNFLTTCTSSYTRKKVAGRSQLYADPKGRSMVEMLGVLAIVGVLSVGAIAGYSKAMMKYKLNKHTEQMNTVINAISRNVHSFDNAKNGTYLTETFIKMGEIPQEMIETGNYHNFHDIFGQQWAIFIVNNRIFLSTNGYSTFLTSKSQESLDICKNILLIAKENHGLIYFLQAYSRSGDKSNSNTYAFHGDECCSSGRKCLKDLTLDDIYRTCAEHYRDGLSVFEFTWKSTRP